MMKIYKYTQGRTHGFFMGRGDIRINHDKTTLDFTPHTAGLLQNIILILM